PQGSTGAYFGYVRMEPADERLPQKSLRRRALMHASPVNGYGQRCSHPCASSPTNERAAIWPTPCLDAGEVQALVDAERDEH
ncbi:MAG: hypothetical protein ACPGUV_05655, partial [Polyangiales bacterium]